MTLLGSVQTTSLLVVLIYFASEFINLESSSTNRLAISPDITRFATGSR